jgi:hypothetical protein
VWQLLHNFVPFRSMLKHRDLSTFKVCLMCEIVAEDLMHGLFFFVRVLSMCSVSVYIGLFL